jgi:putative spermidine/putrescine transport system ATP-binding protein
VAHAMDISDVGDTGKPRAVELQHVRKSFGPVVAVADIDLVIDDGEFFSLLGPSGSGKTTVLRMIAGFERPDSGSVLLGGRDVTSLAPYDRDVNTVFQDYALFPHMTVQENVEYGLRVKGIGRADRRRRAAAMLDTVRLGEYGARRPNQLSGGQRQRVALARALVNHPRVLLLDEPLGALDLKLREEMQIELRTIQREVGVTFVFVTHDQGEALSMSTRVAVFNAGRLEQVGTPQEIYDHPATAFVAGFVGASNLIDDAMSQRILGGPGPHVIRPERIRVLQRESDAVEAGDVVVSGRVSDVLYVGAECRVRVDVGEVVPLLVGVPSAHFADLAVGSAVRLTWPPSAAFALVGSAGAASAEIDPNPEQSDDEHPDDEAK